MKTILYNPIFINPQAYYVFPRLTRYLQPDNESTSEPANYIGTIEVKVIAYGDTTLKRTYTNTDSIDLSEFKNTWIRISLFTKVGSCVLGEWKIGNMESDLPYIDPEVLASLKAVVIVGNKTNNDSDRAIVKNLVDPDNPFVIGNAAFKLNSGFGKYGMDFLEWKANSGMNFTSTKLTSTKPNLSGGWLTFRNVSGLIPETKVKVSGAPREFVFIGNNNGTDDKFSVTINNGVYTIPEFTLSTASGFYINNNSGDWSNLVIEQIPSFEGAFVTDGIDDMITSTKTVQEMLGGSTEFTAVSMIHLISPGQDVGGVAYTNYIRTSDNYWTTNRVSNTDKTGIYGYSFKQGTPTVINNILGDKNDYTTEKSDIVSDGSVSDLFRANFSVEGFEHVINGAVHASSVAWYWTIIANKVLTTDEINQVIAYFNLDRTLKPDMLCNVKKQGITNENHAEFGDKLIDFSGNGRDIQLNNLAWKGGSGIAAKPFETIKDYTIVSDEARQKLTIYNEFSYKVKSNTPNHYWTVQSIIKDNTSYQVTIITDKDCYWINSTSFTNNEGNKESIRKEYPVKANTPTQVTICGLNEFEYPEDIEPTTAVSYVNLSYAGEVTVTFIPSCKGGLLLDGVNDFGQFVGDLGLKDYTLIMNRAYNNLINNQVPLISSNIVEDQTPFIVEHWNTGSNAISFSYGASRTTDIPLDINKKIVYQSTYSYMGYVIPKGNAISTGGGITLGKFGNGVQYSAICLWSLMLFPYSMSEFLIERQLKKHKLGTLYPDMVEFRPVIKSNVLLDAKPTFVIRGTSTYLNAGDYVPENSQIWVSIKMNNIADRITKFTVNGKTIDIPENAYSEVTLQYGFPLVIDKSPQKISITIEQDENYVLFNPVINSNYDNYKLTFHLREYEKLINIGDYIPKGTYIRANLYLKNDIDELVTFTFNGVNIDYAKSPVLDTAYNIRQIYNYDSPQEVNITIDEYIRYEDIVQPYPVVFQIKDRNTNQIYSWGDKIKVGSSIQLTQGENPNLLSGLYSIRSYEYEGETYTYNQLEALVIIITKSGIQLSCNKVWTFDDNEPKCILSPRLLRIPNSSYKILGYIPDISGHGNNGVIHNSAYTEGSGVNEDGSYQFDGVDDFVAIPTLSSGGKQVLMKVNSLNSDVNVIYDQRLPTNMKGTFAIMCDNNLAYSSWNTGQTYIDGILNKNIIGNQLVNITHNLTITNDGVTNNNSKSPFIGKSTDTEKHANMSLYDFMLFDNVSTDDKIKQLNEYVGIEGNTE